MRQVQALTNLTITTILKTSRRVNNTVLRSALQKLLPSVFVETICSIKQHAHNIASTVNDSYFLVYYEPGDEKISVILKKR